MLLIKLNSDNHIDQLVTAWAYERIVLEMSTGDHATHTYELLVVGNGFNEAYLTIDDLEEEAGEA